MILNVIGDFFVLLQFKERPRVRKNGQQGNKYYNKITY